MKNIIFITHANVNIDPKVPVPNWGLSKLGSERHKAFNKNPAIRNITAVYCSEEQKAIDGAVILSAHLNLGYSKIHGLHENDRSSTGFLEPKEFEMVATQFFENSEQSIRGWERAVDAQTRIVNCVFEIAENDKSNGDIAIVAHGGVGTLMLCHLLDSKITRKMDQPPNGGGNYFVFDAASRRLAHQWLTIGE